MLMCQFDPLVGLPAAALQMLPTTLAQHTLHAIDMSCLADCAVMHLNYV